MHPTSLVSSFIYDMPAPRLLSTGFAGAIFRGLADQRHRHACGPVCRSRSRRATSSIPATLLSGPTVSPTAQLDNPTVNQWFNPDAFQLVSCTNSSLPERCHYGNSGNGILEGPGFKNVDFSMFKNFGITERVKLQFRAEFFNLFNTPQFNVPNRGLNTGGGFLPQRAANGTITFPSQAGIVERRLERSRV